MNTALAKQGTTPRNRRHNTAQEEAFVSVFTPTSTEQLQKMSSVNPAFSSFKECFDFH